VAPVISADAPAAMTVAILAPIMSELRISLLLLKKILGTKN
jgi:hypothetical protein